MSNKLFIHHEPNENEDACPYDGIAYSQIPGYISGYGCPICKGIGPYHLPIEKNQNIVEFGGYSFSQETIDMLRQRIQDVFGWLSIGEVQIAACLKNCLRKMIDGYSLEETIEWLDPFK